MFAGIGLVLIVLILFLGSPRSALIVGITVPFAMVMAFILMYHAGISANLLSLGAIDFGIIVDGAIVMTEAILRRREAKPNEPLTEADVRDAACQVARPIFFATAIIITTYLPLFAFQRIEAKLFYPMVYAVGYAQLGALAFALLVVPGLAYVAYRRPRRVFHNPVLELDRSGIIGSLGRLAAPPAHRLSAERRRRRRRGRPRRHGVARIPARSRRRLDLAACRDAARHFVAEGDRHGRRSAPRAGRVSGSVVSREPYRPQRRRHRSVDAVAHGSRGRCSRRTAPGRPARPSRI